MTFDLAVHHLISDITNASSALQGLDQGAQTPALEVGSVLAFSAFQPSDEYKPLTG